MDFVDIRVRFKKQGRARYISHLDLSRFMQRALKRSGLPIWHTEGFNPHPYVTFALPLSLGQIGLYEIMDFRLTQYLPAKEILDRLQACLNEDISIVSVYEPKHKAKEITYAKYELKTSNVTGLLEKIGCFYNQEEIITRKTTKKKVEDINLKPFIKEPSAKICSDELVVEMILPAGTQLNINPSLIISSFFEHTGDEEFPVCITRTDIFLEDMSKFI